MIGLLVRFHSAQAVTITFFDASQATNLVSAEATSDTISSAGYLFTVTRDKLFTGGYGLTNPIGRTVRIPWPTGLEAQAVTAGPVTSGARFTIRRQDGQPFAIPSFTARLLANTAGAGAAIEVMPLLNGEDGFPNPLMCPATGYYGQEFTYQTPTLTGFDSYKITLYVDFALMSLTLVDPSIAPPTLHPSPLNAGTLQLSWPAEAADYTLESSTDLSSNLWITAPEPVTVNGATCTAEVDLTGPQRFFRLRK